MISATCYFNGILQGDNFPACQGLTLCLQVYMPVWHVVLKFSCPTKNFKCPFYFQYTSPIKMHTSYKISTPRPETSLAHWGAEPHRQNHTNSRGTNNMPQACLNVKPCLFCDTFVSAVYTHKDCFKQDSWDISYMAAERTISQILRVPTIFQKVGYQKYDIEAHQLEFPLLH